MDLARYTRWQAAPFHLLISAVVASIVLAVMLLLWYPRPFFEAAGGKMLLLLLIGVDVILGPLLTFIIFDPRKKQLKLDLAVIALLQVAAMAYGGWVMFEARPVYVAFAGDRFELVSANEISSADLDKAEVAFRSLPLTGPRIVGTQLPQNPFELANLGIASLMGGSIGLFPQHYVSYDKVSREVTEKAQPFAKLRQRNPEQSADIDSYIAAIHKPERSLRYLPLQSRRGSMSVVIDAVSGEVQGVVAIDPW